MSVPRDQFDTQAEWLTAQYDAWDYRLRGYDLWTYPVAIEPPFQVFRPDYGESDVSDDTRKHTALSGLIATIASWYDASEESPTQQSPDTTADFLADLYVPDEALIELQIALPGDIEYSVARMEQCLLNCVGLKHPLCIEYIGTGTQVIVQFSCREPDEALVLQNIESLFPEAIVSRQTRYLERVFSQPLGSYAAVDYALEKICAVPLAAPTQREADSLTTLVAALAQATEDESLVVQFMFTPVVASWREAIVGSLRCNDGTCFFGDAPHLLKHAEQKVNGPLFAALIRTCVKSVNSEAARHHLQRLGSALSQFNGVSGQGLIPLNNDGYPDEIHVDDILGRITHRSGMLLNSHELSQLAHLPQRTVTNEKLVRIAEKTKQAPLVSQGHETVLGTNIHRGDACTVSLSKEHRLRHTYIVGASGTGKSTLLSHLMRQDLLAGNGIALLDPHGDLVDDILTDIPESRLNDVILFDPSDEGHPIGFNIIDARSDAEKTLIASDMVATFRRLSTSWGDQMNAVLANGIIAILEHEDGGTLMTLRRFLVEKSYRERFLEGVEDSEVRYYWTKEYPLLRGNSHSSVLTRLDAFLRSRIIRNMVAQQKNRIDFADIMSSQKIFLAKLPHGVIGEENASLLGTLLITALNQAAQRRQSIGADDRVPFFVYIDEFQNFITPTMESILSGSRKYGMALTLAHQDLWQLTSKSREVASSVLTNPCTRICFRTGDTDSATLAKGYSSFEPQDFRSLGIGEAIARIEQAKYDFNLRVPAPPCKSIESPADRIVALSRAKYATDRNAIEASIRSLYGDKYKVETPGDGRSSIPERVAKEHVSAKPVRADSPVADAPSEAPVQKTDLKGRGGPQHRYLQSLIKKLALERGFGAETEASVLGGHGAVDVLLTYGELKIACEVTITTPAKHEVQNVQKCLAAGVNTVVLIGQDRGKLREIRKGLRDFLDPEMLAKVKILVPDEFLPYLDTVRATAKQVDKRVRGYKVNVSYTSTTKLEQKQKQDAIAKLIVKSLRRMTSD